MTSTAETDEDLSSPPPPRRHSFYQRNLSLLRGILAIVAAFVIWELIGRFVMTNRLFFVPFSAVLEGFVQLWAKGELQTHITTSLVEFALGFILASMVGVLIGLGMAVSRLLHDYLDPWVSLLYSTPILALAPLFILWFGLGIESKVAVIFLVVLFPVLLNTYTGVLQTEPHFVEAARSFGASSVQVFTKVMLPSALPVILTGLRLGMARGLVGVVVAELFGSKAGLGFLILVSAQTFDMASLFVGVTILAGFGVISVELLKVAERRLAPWRHADVRE